MGTKTIVENQKNEKTSSITLRLNKEVLDQIKQVADTGGISINTLINQILSKEVNWDLPASKGGWIPLPQAALVAIMEQLDDKKVIQVAQENGKNIPKDLLLLMRGKIGVKEWVDILKYRALVAGFKYSEFEENNSVKFITQHNMGLKWSKYFNAYYETALKQLGCPAKYSFTENSVVFIIDKKYL